MCNVWFQDLVFDLILLNYHGYIKPLNSSRDERLKLRLNQFNVDEVL